MTKETVVLAVASIMEALDEVGPSAPETFLYLPLNQALNLNLHNFQQVMGLLNFR